MTTVKRGRGRPEDASRHREADHARLASMAELIAAAPDLKPDTAMARIKIHEDSVKRRLRRRWKRYGEDYLARARQALQARTPQTSDESAAIAMVQRVPRSIRERYGVPGDTMRILDQYRALSDMHKIGAIAGLAKLAAPSLISPDVAKQIGTTSIWGNPEMQKIGAALAASTPGATIRTHAPIGAMWRKLMGPG